MGVSKEFSLMNAPRSKLNQPDRDFGDGRAWPMGNAIKRHLSPEGGWQSRLLSGA